MSRMLSPTEVEVAQVMALVATGVFIGLRFVPVRCRWPIGILLTACYGIGIVVFAVYIWLL